MNLNPILFQLQKTSLTETTIVNGAQHKGSTATANSATFSEALQENPLRFESKFQEKFKIIFFCVDFHSATEKSTSCAPSLASCLGC